MTFAMVSACVNGVEGEACSAEDGWVGMWCASSGLTVGDCASACGGSVFEDTATAVGGVHADVGELACTA